MSLPKCQVYLSLRIPNDKYPCHDFRRDLLSTPAAASSRFRAIAARQLEFTNNISALVESFARPGAAKCMAFHVQMARQAACWASPRGLTPPPFTPGSRAVNLSEAEA